jgi:hypothetical protein
MIPARTSRGSSPARWEDNVPQVISVQQMRRGVGRLAVLLPLVIGAGYCIFGKDLGGFLGAISESYYTVMRDVFVGTLCAVAFFLYAYRGYNHREDWLFNFLALLCVVVAWFSMTSTPLLVEPLPGPSCSYSIKLEPTCAVVVNDRLATYHYEIFGLLHFGAATVLFVCLGYVSPFLFIVETVCLEAFGISWLLKGDGIFGLLSDRPAQAAPAPGLSNRVH